ncbi:hypothetical protein OROGR_030007 [Orobanche gracilis]
MFCISKPIHLVDFRGLFLHLLLRFSCRNDSIIMVLNYIFFLAFLVKVLSSYAALNTYVVHMDRTKMKALDISLGTSKRWFQEVMESIDISSTTNDDGNRPPFPRLHYVYEKALSGFAASLSEEHLESLKKIDGFLYATRDELRTLHTTHSPQFLGLQERKGLWSAENLASDVIIGVIDSGIWPEHTSFDDAGLSEVPSRWKGICEVGQNFTASNCNKKLIGARAFFKGYEAAINGTMDPKLDYRSPRDSEGHGTHTASTAGVCGRPVGGANILGVANGTAAGMRYTARIAAYKACYSLGCHDSDLLAAMNQALKDGVDVVSMSIGGPPKPYYNDSIAIAAFGAMRHGVLVSTSAGNSGPHSGSVCNSAPWLMTVAASSTNRRFLAQVRLGDGTVLSGASLLPYSQKPSKHLLLFYGRNCTSGSLSTQLVKGKTVICDRRGNNTRLAKGDVVNRVGGAAMILANLENQGEDTLEDAQVLPTVSLGALASDVIRKYANASSNATSAFTFQGETYDNRAPVVSAFSSRGPNSVDPNVIKPDVTAPGLNILAAWPSNLSPTQVETDRRRVRFNMLSGTSMSCPHVTGLIALLKSQHKDWSPAAIKSALMTTAYVVDSNGSPVSDGGFSVQKPANPFAFGSGHVDPEHASDPGLIYNISSDNYLHYLCSLNYNHVQMAPFTTGLNFSCSAGSHSEPGDLNYPSFSVVFSGNDSEPTLTYKRTVTNVGTTPPSHYYVKVIEPEGVSITVRPKVLAFKKVGEKQCYSVTFTAKRGRGTDLSAGFSFGSLEWVSNPNKYSVRSPVAVTWAGN